jgi:hypothetical protein
MSPLGGVEMGGGGNSSWGFSIQVVFLTILPLINDWVV